MFANSTFARNAIAAVGALIIGGACLTVAATPAAAATETVKISKVVSYADLNLSNRQGRAALDARIRAAAQSVCGNQGSDLAARMAETRCIKSAIRAANAS